MFKECGLLNSKLGVKRCMLRAFHGLPTTVKKGVMNIPRDFQWYTTMTKVAISIVKESQDLKCHSIKCKFVNKSRYFVRLAKKSLQF
jgi:hypothetical protein